MNASWLAWGFGGGTWTTWYGLLFIAFLMLLGVTVYAMQDPAGPSATPFLMMGLFFIAFGIFVVLSPIDAWLWATAQGYSVLAKIFLVPATWVLLAFLWTFLFWATDPNYPEKLLPGRILFPLYSLLIYAANLWLLWRIRPT